VTETQVDDISSCSKTLLVTVSWQLGARYATSTIALFTHLTQPEEVIARGGDCLLMAPTGDWFGSVPSQVGSVSQLPQFTTGFDVLGEFVYMVASSAPQLRIYATPTALGQAPVLVGSSTGMGNRLNAIDVIRDFGTGRTYAYVMQHTKTDQLGVFDVTNPASPTWLLSLSLSGADPTGSFPQGWRVVAYGERLYTLTRDTLGFEFHVFDIGDPSSPQPVHSSMVNLVRTVNDMTVREQTLAGLKRRFVFLAASAGLKELVLLEVTRGVPVERSVVNLPGAADAAALYLRGNLLYLGRRNNNSGPELYVFDIPTLLGGSTSSLAVAELGADVTTIRGTGAVLYVGTSKSGEEFQVWPADYTVWQATVPNASRISATAFPKLAPVGIDLSAAYLYTVSQSATLPETIGVFYVP
jgi:hypothetical protein